MENQTNSPKDGGLPFPEDTNQEDNINIINIDSENNPNSQKNNIPSLMDNPINEKKIKTLSKYFEESFKVDGLIEENEDSKEIFLPPEKENSLFNKSEIEDLISEQSHKNENQYLKPKLWKYTDKNNFEDIDKKYISIKNKLNRESIKNKINEIKEKSIENLYSIEKGKKSEYKINKIQCFENMIENYIRNNDKKQSENEKEELEKYIYKYRNMFIDNNNFYRCVIFSFLENIILTNNYMFLKELLFEIDDKVNVNNNKIKNNDYLKNEIELYVKIDTIKELLYILIKYMTKNISKSYEVFIKIYLLYEEFDYGMIFILRYLLHEYIYENKYKTYSEEEETEISDLLPSKYYKMRITIEKKFDLFFINELLKMKSYDCKIVFYFIPYYFDINLKIISFYQGTDNPIYTKAYREGNDKFTLELLSFKGNYYICYNKKYYEFHCKTLSIFEEKGDKILLNKKFSTNSKNSVEISILGDDNIKMNDINIDIKDIKEDQGEKKLICENCSKEYKEINKLNFCRECLDYEFKTDILKLYGLYLQYVDHNYKKYSLQIEKYFRNIIHTIKIKDISIYEAMEGTGYLVYEILNQVKQNICIICRNDTTKNYYYELPCGCRHCSKQCFKKYIDIMIYKEYEKIDKNDYKRQVFVFDYCICGKKYYYDDLIILYNYFKNKKKEKNCEMIIKIVQNRWKWKCIKCDKLFDPFCLNRRLSLLDPKINEDFYEKEIKHLICSECFDTISSNQIRNIKCIFCKSEHFMVGSTGLNYENKTGELCYII